MQRTQRKAWVFIEKTLCALCAFAVRDSILGFIQSFLKKIIQIEHIGNSHDASHERDVLAP